MGFFQSFTSDVSRSAEPVVNASVAEGSIGPSAEAANTPDAALPRSEAQAPGAQRNTFSDSGFETTVVPPVSAQSQNKRPISKQPENSALQKETVGIPVTTPVLRATPPGRGMGASETTVYGTEVPPEPHLGILPALEAVREVSVQVDKKLLSPASASPAPSGHPLPQAGDGVVKTLVSLMSTIELS